MLASNKVRMICLTFAEEAWLKLDLSRTSPRQLTAGASESEIAHLPYARIDRKTTIDTSRGLRSQLDLLLRSRVTADERALTRSPKDTKWAYHVRQSLRQCNRHKAAADERARRTTTSERTAGPTRSVAGARQGTQAEDTRATIMNL